MPATPSWWATRPTSLSLLPSGVVQGKRSIIGNGVVVDPWSLLDEIARVGAGRPDDHAGLLVLAENAVLVLPLHRELDAMREDAASQKTRHHQARHRARL